MRLVLQRVSSSSTQNSFWCSLANLGSLGVLELIEGISDLKPVAKTASRPVYSNLPYFLFSHALEVATGKNYTTLLRELVTEPLGMNDTKESPGDDSEAVIPPIENLWGSPYAHHLP
jgi:CubicO group peptidase (beta-lactamase class C family)